MLVVRNVESGTWQRPVSFDVYLGELAVLLGRNSSGKTTLLNTIAGLLPIRAGEIIIGNRDVTRMDSVARAQEGVRIALEGRQIFGSLAVRRNLLLGAYGISSKREVAVRIQAVLDVFPDLQKKLDAPAWSLSGGQQTMLNIGRALMGNPVLLLLDEPMLGLDPQNTRQLVSALRRIQHERMMTVLVAEQSAIMARSFAERVLLMNGGEILFDGCLQDAQGSAGLSEVFI